MPPPVHIDRCVCTEQSFAALLELARERGLDLAELAALTGASDRCTRCRPYLRRALRTGETVFHELLPEDEPEPQA